MYYPIGWHKVLKLDTSKCDQDNLEPVRILEVQANHEKELYFILTTRSLHIWNPMPAVEIVCHRRTRESVELLGLNKVAVWRTDSSVIVVATELDQLLFFHLRKRSPSASTWSFLSQSSNESDGIYRLKCDPKQAKKLRNGELGSLLNNQDQPHIPALTMYSFGKLDLSTIGIACIMSAEEELIVGCRDGQIYGIQWDGNVDDKFPWSLTKDVRARSDFLVDIKFSSVLSGFSLVFRSGRVGFMPLKLEQDIQHEKVNEMSQEAPICDTNISYLASINNAVCTEINHRHRLVAFGQKDSRITVCNIGELNTTLVVNHTLELETGKNHINTIDNNCYLGRVECLRYSPDNFAIAVSWEGGEIALWSVFGSLLFCSQQWRPESGLGSSIRHMSTFSMSWGREGYNLWLCAVKDGPEDGDSTTCSANLSLEKSTNGKTPNDIEASSSATSISTINQQKQEVMILSLARCNLSTSPHQSCSADSLVLIADEKIYIGPSIPHEDKFDHWIVVNIPSSYLKAQYPIRYATVDRDCRNLAIAGNKGLALYSIGTCKWSNFIKKSQEESFTACGDLIWWRDYLLVSCFNFYTESFELRAYPTKSENLDMNQAYLQQIPMEIIRMSIFENRLLVLYSDGTLGMFMLNLKRRPGGLRKQPRLTPLLMNDPDSVSGAGSRLNDQKEPTLRVGDSIINCSHPLKNPALIDSNFIVQISPIDNLCISNLQANPFCISSIALTRLHFKNYRNDDSILLNACGKLFLLEREVPPDPNLSSSSPVSSSNLSSPDIKGNESLSLDIHQSSVHHNLDMKVNSAKILANTAHYASASLKSNLKEPSALSNVTFKAVSVIATNVEQYWISPEISIASEMSYFKKSLWLSCGNPASRLKVWLPLLNDKLDPPTDLYVPDRIMLPIKCDIYPLAIRSSAADLVEPDDAIVLGAESDVLYRDCKLFTYFPYTNVKRQCRVYLHRILRELLLSQHLGYYAKKIAESCQSLPYFAHCFELLLHEVLEEEATSPVPLPDPMLPQVVKFIREFPVYLETVVHCARKSELSMWSYLFDERAVGTPRRLFQECIERKKYDTAASCLIILQSLDKSTISSRMVREMIQLVKEHPKFNYLVDDLETFLSRAELDAAKSPGSTPSGGSPANL